MKHRRLHPWNVTIQRAASIQEDLRSRLDLRVAAPLRSLKNIAGADVSYDRGGDVIFGAVVVLSWPDLELVEKAGSVGRAEFPYVPGYLSFREIPVLLHAFSSIRRKPDVVFCDGQGIAHPRGFGLACHLGMILDVSSLGCAKSRLVGDHGEPGRSRGSSAPLTYKGLKVGTVLRTRDGVAPIYVSPGHRIDHDTATRLTLSCCRGMRIPEPTRLAHIEVNRLRREHGLPPVEGEDGGEVRAPARARRPHGAARGRSWTGA